VDSGIRYAEVIADPAFELSADERRPGVEPIETIIDDRNELTLL
jgi:hypothetical protein